MSVDVFLAILFGVSLVVAIVLILPRKKKGDDELSPWLDATHSLDVDDD